MRMESIDRFLLRLTFLLFGSTRYVERCLAPGTDTPSAACIPGTVTSSADSVGFTRIFENVYACITMFSLLLNQRNFYKLCEAKSIKKKLMRQFFKPFFVFLFQHQPQHKLFDNG